ncbi:MAG: S-methyl-5'-thioadenosine phosphorylase, partial [Erythrobacter sp.]
DTALDDAVITAADEHDPELLAKLDAVAGRLFAED